jgi:hypothetical protein
MSKHLDAYQFPAACSRCNAQCATKDWELAASTPEGPLLVKVPLGETCEKKLRTQVILRLGLINLGIYVLIYLLSLAGMLDSWYLNIVVGLLFSAASLTYLSNLRHSIGSKEIGVLNPTAAEPVVTFHNPDYQQQFTALNPTPTEQ